MESVLSYKLYENLYFAEHLYLSPWNYLLPLRGVCLVLCLDHTLWEEALAYTSVSIIEKLETLSN